MKHCRWNCQEVVFLNAIFADIPTLVNKKMISAEAWSASKMNCWTIIIDGDRMLTLC
jgi:hypothetical protein